VTVATAPRQSYALLHELMRRFQVDRLVNTDRDSFRRRLCALTELENRDAFADPDTQNPMAVRFQWGHRHDFGDFGMEGRMGNHHIAVLATFIDELQALPPTLEGCRVLDVGCWTGGTSLLLAALGAEVVAVEEVAMYAEAARYLAWAFGLEQVRVHGGSLYDCTGPEWDDAFDYVLLAGVLHHVSDPRLALRITFNSLRDGGSLLLETLSCEHELPHVADSDAPAWGWNLLLFEPARLAEMIESTGYRVTHPPRVVDRRSFVAARRDRHRDVWRCGLASPGIR
jgi:2-polyprenyl-3-methyl-5-hydroxy-6-metoxy-1,4-benzoquinol methylase